VSYFSVVNSNSLFESIFAIYRAMASAPPSELLEAELDKANSELEHWTLELEKASAALERGKEKGDERQMELAEERIATAKESITRAEEDIEMYMKGIKAPPPAAQGGRAHILLLPAVRMSLGLVNVLLCVLMLD